MKQKSFFEYVRRYRPQYCEREQLAEMAKRAKLEYVRSALGVLKSLSCAEK